MLVQPDLFGDVSASTVDPDDLAGMLWRLYRDRTQPEAVVNALVV